MSESLASVMLCCLERPDATFCLNQCAGTGPSESASGWWTGVPQRLSPLFSCHWAAPSAKIWRNQGKSNHRGVPRCGRKKWAALGTCVLIAIFPIWSVLTSLLILPPPLCLSSCSPPAQGRIIVCHVTLRMCNAGPRAALALHVLICRVALSLTSVSVVCTRGDTCICNNTSVD